MVCHVRLSVFPVRPWEGVGPPVGETGVVFPGQFQQGTGVFVEFEDAVSGETGRTGDPGKVLRTDVEGVFCLIAVMPASMRMPPVLLDLIGIFHRLFDLHIAPDGMERRLFCLLKQAPEKEKVAGAYMVIAPALHWPKTGTQPTGSFL